MDIVFMYMCVTFNISNTHLSWIMLCVYIAASMSHDMGQVEINMLFYKKG